MTADPDARHIDAHVLPQTTSKAAGALQLASGVTGKGERVGADDKQAADGIVLCRCKRQLTGREGERKKDDNRFRAKTDDHDAELSRRRQERMMMMRLFAPKFLSRKRLVVMCDNTFACLFVVAVRRLRRQRLPSSPAKGCVSSCLGEGSLLASKHRPPSSLAPFLLLLLPPDLTSSIGETKKQSSDRRAPTQEQQSAKKWIHARGRERE